MPIRPRPTGCTARPVRPPSPPVCTADALEKSEVADDGISLFADKEGTLFLWGPANETSVPQLTLVPLTGTAAAAVPVGNGLFPERPAPQSSVTQGVASLLYAGSVAGADPRVEVSTLYTTQYADGGSHTTQLFQRDLVIQSVYYASDPAPPRAGWLYWIEWPYDAAHSSRREAATVRRVALDAHDQVLP